MLCISCSEQNAESARFCANCGARFASACSSCKAELPAGAKFCASCGTPAETALASPERTPAPAPALPSAFVGGRYVVKGFLGEGGRKRVYLAHDTKLDRDVAFAVIKTEGLDTDGVERVHREAQAMGRLGDHPHIVTIHDVGEESGQPYIVSQYMAGGDIERLLGAAPNRQLPFEEAIRIAEQVCDGLDHAHSRGIIHRDLKPGNIWLTEDGTAKIGDFGLAMTLDRSRLTVQGMMVGTVGYMPPEQALGRAADARSDLYSLGCILYETLTGRPPFLGEDAVAVISQHINTAPVAVSYHSPAVPRALEALVLRLLAKSPDERPAKAAAVSAELKRIRESMSQTSIVEQQAGASAAVELQGVAWGSFVGRREEMGQLQAALDNALSGRSSLMMIVGEPGIGKTRLAQEFAVYAGLRGAQVLAGHCYEGEAAVPYLPFVEAFRHYARSRPDDAVRQEMGQGAPEVATLISEVRQRFPDIPVSPPLEGEAERHRLFQSVTEFLRNAASANPLVLLLDDLHWSDKPSLLLLQYLVRGLRNDRILIVGAYRDVELERTHPLAEVLSSLRREPVYKRVLLRGLPEEDIVALLQAVSEEDTTDQNAAGRRLLAAALSRETEGNPFFVREVLSHLVEEGRLFRDENGRWTTGGITDISELGIPEGVREVIGRRLSRLSEGCNRMLTLVSTMTGGFTWDALKAVSGEDEAKLLDLLDEALSAQLIHERKGDQAGSYDFTHALIRQTLYEELSTPRRVLLHRQIGEALEKLYEANPELHLTELAHHFFQAAPGGDVDKAVGYARRAGDRATALLAHEEAAQQYTLALQALELSPKRDQRLRCELLMAQAESLVRAGEGDRALESLRPGLSLAEDIADPQLIGEMALTYAIAANRGSVQMTGEGKAQIEHALTIVDDGDNRLRCRLLTMQRVTPGTDWTASIAAVREAVTMAQRLGEAQLEGQALTTLLFLLQGPQNTEERALIAAEAARLAEQSGDKRLQIQALDAIVTNSLELGDIEAADNAIATVVRLAEEIRETFFLGYKPFWSAMRHIMSGRLPEGEQETQRGFAHSQRQQLQIGIQLFAIQLFNIRLQQGRAGEMEPMIKRVVDENPAVAAWLPVLALCYLVSGKEAECRDIFERLAAENFTAVPQDGGWLTAMNRLGTIAAFFGDKPRAAVLHQMLIPYRHRNIVILNGIICDGSAARALGMLAATLERWDEAQDLFEEAFAMNKRIGARPYVGKTQADWARMLLDRGGPGDRERALKLLDEALSIFQEIGMKWDIEQALKLKVQAQGIESSDLHTSIDRVAASVQSQHPDLKSHAAPDGTVTIMFSDIEGSTVLTERLGDQRWMEVLREHNAIVRKAVKSHGGFEVKSEGDGFMVAFQSAGKALACASAIQRALATRNARVGAPPGDGGGEGGAAPRGGTGTETPVEPVLVRMGLHAGEVIKEGEDFFGRNVIMAARVASQANGGEILTSGVVKALLQGSDVTWGDSRMVALKGLSGEHEIWAVEWNSRVD
jgi:eukaryotic-like serine/threonine-protein kinase